MGVQAQNKRRAQKQSIWKEKSRVQDESTRIAEEQDIWMEEKQDMNTKYKYIYYLSTLKLTEALIAPPRELMQQNEH